MSNDIRNSDPALAAALDSFAAPLLSGDFLDRLGIAAEARVASSNASPLRRSGRSGWARGRIALVSLAGFGLMSAAAAATGVFGPITRETPVIGSIIATVADSIKPSPKPKRAEVKLAAKPAGAKIAAPRVITETADGVRVESKDVPPELAMIEQREAMAQRIAQKLDERAKRRRMLGLPPIPVPHWLVEERLAFLPPGERRAVMLRARELRQERNEERRAQRALGIAPQSEPPRWRQHRDRLRDVPVVPDGAAASPPTNLLPPDAGLQAEQSLRFRMQTKPWLTPQERARRRDIWRARKGLPPLDRAMPESAPPTAATEATPAP